MSTIAPIQPVVKPVHSVPADNPRSTWPDWCDEDRWTVTEGGPSPSWDAERFEPSDAEELEASEHGPEYDAHVDARLASRGPDDWHEAEVIEAAGVLVARLPGGDW